VPVRAWPIRSAPPRAIGRVISWIAKVRVMPTAARASTISGLTSKALNVGLSGLTGACAGQRFQLLGRLDADVGERVEPGGRGHSRAVLI
jgi:hypothetical protein